MTEPRLPREPADTDWLSADPIEDRLNRVVSTLLDTLAGLAIAGGLGAGLFRWLGWFGWSIAGVVLLLFSVIATAMRTPRALPAAPPAAMPPGPEDAGVVHMRGSRAR
jgi:hypothetical protein